MGFEVSGTFLIIFFGVLVAMGAIYTTYDSTADRVTEAHDARLSDSIAQAETEIEIRLANWNSTSGELTIEIENTGTTQLTVDRTRVLLDGDPTAPGDATERTIDGDSDTDLWGPGETLRLVYGRNANRIRVVTEHGISAFTRRTNTSREPVVFANNNALQTMKQDQFPTGRYRVDDARVVGPLAVNLDDDPEGEIPYVNSSGSLNVVDINGEDRQLVDGAQSDFSKLAVGRWQDSRLSVFYVNDSTNNIDRVTARGRRETVATVTADAVGGIADIDGDGNDELVYGGDSPGGISDTVNYVDDDGTAEGTGVSYGVNGSAVGLGEPANFNGSQGDRVPIVDGSNNIVLVGAGGETEQLTSTGSAAKAPLAALDWDADSRPEILYVESNGNLRFLDDVTRANSITTVFDPSGNDVPADAGDSGAS